MKRKTPKTPAENQEDSKSSNEGTRQLSKQLPLATSVTLYRDSQWPRNSLPSEKAARKKTTVFQ